MTLAVIVVSLSKGSRLVAICERFGLSVRTVHRWRMPEKAEDRGWGPRTTPATSLAAAEREQLLTIVNTEEFRELSPKQIVPRLAECGHYVASESVSCRILRSAKPLAHRGEVKERVPRPRLSLAATGPNQVYSWDITCLLSPIRGAYFYLYMVVDVYSRRIVGWEVHAHGCSMLAAALICRFVAETDNLQGFRLHSDKGGPMKGSTLKTTLETLGVAQLYDRPRVSDENPFSEALFRTLKSRPDYPYRPFASLEAVRKWAKNFVAWYNREHHHSAIKFVATDERHYGLKGDVLQNRLRVIEAARRGQPERWSKGIRDLSPAGQVHMGKTLREREIDGAA